MENVRKLREIMRFTVITLVFGGLLALTGPATEANAAEPIAGLVTAIDAKTGRVTAKEITKPAEPVGRTFEFEVKDRAALGKLKVGQKVFFDTDMKTGAKGSLKLSGGEAVGIVVIGTRPAAPVRVKVSPFEPVNDARITAIDARTGLVTAREITKPAEPVGKTFQFQVKDKAILGNLKVGQAVHADFASTKVSLKPGGAEAVGIIVVGGGPAGAR